MLPRALRLMPFGLLEKPLAVRCCEGGRRDELATREWSPLARLVVGGGDGVRVHEELSSEPRRLNGMISKGFAASAERYCVSATE